MPLRFSPCDTCPPCETCSLASDNFDRSDDTNLGASWTEDSGSWAIVSNKLACTSAGRARHSYADADGKYSIRVRVTLTSVSDIARVIVGYGDSTHYVYAQVERTTSGAGTLKLYRINGGSPSQLGTTKSWSATGDIDVMVCWNAITVSASVSIVGGATNQAYVAAATTSTGNGHGLEVSTVASSILFDDYAVIEAATETTSTCPACPNECGGCDNGVAPTVVKLVMAGFTGSTACYNGTYFLPMASNCVYRAHIPSCANPAGYFIPCVLVVQFLDAGATWATRVVLNIRCHSVGPCLAAPVIPTENITYYVDHGAEAHDCMDDTVVATYQSNSTGFCGDGLPDGYSAATMTVSRAA